MKIRSHLERHIVELDDGSRWKIFPGDLDVTLQWKPETDLLVESSDDEVSSHALANAADKSSVRVIPATENWTVREVKKSPQGRLRAIAISIGRAGMSRYWPRQEPLEAAAGSNIA